MYFICTLNDKECGNMLNNNDNITIIIVLFDYRLNNLRFSVFGQAKSEDVTFVSGTFSPLSDLFYITLQEIDIVISSESAPKDITGLFT